MSSDSIVHVVARALDWHMRRMKLNESALGKRAKVSPRTVGNFLRPDKREISASGKVPSGKLTELEMIARALGVSFVDLVLDMSDDAREERRRIGMAVDLLAGRAPAEPPPQVIEALKGARGPSAKAQGLHDDLPTPSPAPHRGKPASSAQPKRPARKP